MDGKSGNSVAKGRVLSVVLASVKKRGGGRNPDCKLKGFGRLKIVWGEERHFGAGA